MNIREQAEEREFQYLSRYASHSRESKGRERVEEECDIRTVYQRDRDRIIHSKAFRRLKDKTQVFLAAQGDHYRTRLTHTLEVSQTARTIAKALELNEDLVEAIALGHDLGHTPFGHAGEAALNEICPKDLHILSRVSGWWNGWKRTGGTESDLGSKGRDVESPDIRHTAYPGRSGSPTV